MTRASVMVGAVETSYRRAGRGPTVLILTGAPPFPSTDAASLRPLVERARVIVPEHVTVTALAMAVAESETPFGRWLDGFLEGIGVHEVNLVAPETYAPEVQRFATRHPGVVSQCHLVGDDVPSWTMIADALLGQPSGEMAG